MAFNRSSAAAVVVPANQTWEKASAFFNLYLPKKNGSRAKVGAVPLRLSKDTEKMIMDIIAKDGSPDRVLSKLIIEYNPVNVVNDDDFDI